MDLKLAKEDLVLFILKTISLIMVILLSLTIFFFFTGEKFTEIVPCQDLAGNEILGSECKRTYNENEHYIGSILIAMIILGFLLMITMLYDSWSKNEKEM